jgi:hypothetical protein
MAIKQVFNSSAELNYPKVLPTLDLNFANTKTLDPRITFTRASGGSYVGADGLIKYAGVNEARFDHDPVTGESLGLLVEEGRTNFNPDSSNMSQWVPNGGSILFSNDTVAPDGTTTAGKLTGEGQPFHGYFKTGISLSTNTAYTISSFIKPVDQPITRFGIFSGVEWYGFVDTIWSANGTPSTFAIGGLTTRNINYQKYSNGWYRASFTFTTPSTVVLSQYAHQPDRESARKSAWFWGAQLEAGAFPTSYIPTQASTRTRAADNASITGKNFSDFYNKGTGTIFSNFSSVGSLSDNRIVYAISDNTFNNSMYLLSAVANFGNQTIQAIFLNGFGQGFLSSLGGVYRNYSFVKTAFAFENKNSAFVIDRRDVSRNFTGGIPNVNRIYLGASWSGGENFLNGHISRLTYFPKRLPNSQLQALTS